MVCPEGTRGISTANSGYRLSDGAVIVLTFAWLADRTEHVYGGVIEPDVLIDGAATGNEDTDPAILAAKA